MDGGDYLMRLALFFLGIFGFLVILYFAAVVVVLPNFTRRLRNLPEGDEPDRNR